MFKIQDGRDKFYQWDLNRKLIVEDSSITQVHFSNAIYTTALVCEVIDGIVNVPNIILQDEFDIYVYGYDRDYTKHSATFNVVKRTKPESYVYTETEILNYNVLLDRINAVNENIVEYVDNAVSAIPQPDLSGYQEKLTAGDNIIIEGNVISSTCGSGIELEVNQIKKDLAAEQTAREQADTSLQQELSWKLPKSPANWEPWTAEEQAAARERMDAQGSYKHIATITIDEDGVYKVGIDRDENGMVFSVSDVYIYGYMKRTGSSSQTAVAINTITTNLSGSNNIIKLPSNYQIYGAQFELNIKKSKYWRAYAVSSIDVIDPNINTVTGSTSVSHRGASNVRKNEWETLTALAFATDGTAFGIGTTFDIWGR